jgi:hypothetical protein
VVDAEACRDGAVTKALVAVMIMSVSPLLAVLLNQGLSRREHDWLDALADEGVAPLLELLAVDVG